MLQSVLQCVLQPWDVGIPHAQVISHMNESRHTWMSHITYEWVTSHMKESRHTWLLCMPALCRRNMKVPTSISQQISICTKSLFICIADDYLRTAPPGAERIKSVINLSYQKNDNFGSDRYWTRSSHQHSGLSWTFPYGGVTHSDAIWLLHVWCDSFISPRN